MNYAIAERENSAENDGNSDEINILSLKVVPSLVDAIRAQSNNAASGDPEVSITFVSKHEAIIQVGEYEYELKYSEVNLTECYEIRGGNELKYFGTIEGRFISSNPTKTGAIAVTNRLSSKNTTEKSRSQKRAISVLSNENEAALSASQVNRSVARKTVTIDKPASANTNVNKNKNVIKLQTSWTILRNIPGYARHKDLLDFLDNLSVKSFYAVRNCSTNTSTSAANNDTTNCRSTATRTSDITLSDKFDIYTEYETISSAELSLLRNGEFLFYKDADSQQQSVTVQVTSTQKFESLWANAVGVWLPKVLPTSAASASGDVGGNSVDADATTSYRDAAYINTSSNTNTIAYHIGDYIKDYIDHAQSFQFPIEYYTGCSSHPTSLTRAWLSVMNGKLSVDTAKHFNVPNHKSLFSATTDVQFTTLMSANIDRSSVANVSLNRDGSGSANASAPNTLFERLLCSITSKITSIEAIRNSILAVNHRPILSNPITGISVVDTNPELTKLLLEQIRRLLVMFQSLRAEVWRIGFS